MDPEQPDIQPEPVVPDPAPNPWEPLTQRGFDPTGYDPDEIVNGANLYKALTSRDYRDGAVQQVLNYAGFPEGTSLQDLREYARQQSERDPWAFGGQEDEYEEQPGYAQQFDPRQFQSAVDQTVERRLAEFQQRLEAEKQQQAYEQEFTSHLDRVAGQHNLGNELKVGLAAHANMLRQQMPYASTEQVLDAAGKSFIDAMNNQFRQMAMQQQDTPTPPMPGGPIPSQTQPAQNAQEAAEMWRQRAAGM